MIAALLTLVVSMGAQAPDQEALARAIRGGTTQERYVAVRQILAIPPAERNEHLYDAAANELLRIASTVRARAAASRARNTTSSVTGPNDAAHDETASEVYEQLIEIVAEWNDDRALPPLVASMSGMISTRAIVRFGEKAVRPLLDVVRGSDPARWGSGLITLTILLDGHTDGTHDIPPAELSRASKQSILQLAREMMQPRAIEYFPWPAAAALALATGDEELRRRVELLAAEPGIVSQFTGVTDPVRLSPIQAGIRAALRDHQKR